MGTQDFIKTHLADQTNKESIIKINNPRESKLPSFRMEYTDAETMKKSFERYQAFFRKTREYFRVDKYSEVIICVTHGNAFDSILPMYLSKKEIEKYELDGDWPPDKFTMIGVNYCAITVLKCLQVPDLKRGKWQLVGDFATSEHIGLGKSEFHMAK